MLTLKAALEEATAAVGRVDAHALVAHELGVDRAYLAAHPMRILTETEDARVELAVAQRALGRPVAYLVGRREFYSRDFEVTPDVLIPRPETETLVEAALSRVAGLARPAILDLGTGSGAVAVTLACERPDAVVVATESSPGAAEVARRNARRLGATVEVLRGSWYEPVGARRFALVVANPPYVAAGDPHLARGDLRFEPRVALTDGSADGLASIRAIVAGARAHLEPGGWLLFEHGYDQAGAARELLAAAGFEAIDGVPDLAGIPRVAGGKIA